MKRPMAAVNASNLCWWRWRFQPVFAVWGHLGLDYTFENPLIGKQFWLRHVDYGLPGDRQNPNYRHSIALHCAVLSDSGEGWPPVRTPFGRLFGASGFQPAPRQVAEYLQGSLPRFWGRHGAYRTLGPNSNTGLRHALAACAAATGYDFGHPPGWIRLRSWGWDLPFTLSPEEGPYAGYFDNPDRFRWTHPTVEPFDTLDQAN